MRKLSRKERNEHVTKGYLTDHLEEVLESKDYINKKDLYNFGENLKTSLVMELGALIEDQNTYYDALYQENDSKVTNHEERIVKLENNR